MATKKIKNRYVEMIGVTVIALSLVRCAFPGVAGDLSPKPEQEQEESQEVTVEAEAEAPIVEEPVSTPAPPPIAKIKPKGKLTNFNYKDCFPDGNEVQLTAARQWGVLPVKSREEAEWRMRELVYVGSSPYYSIAPLNASIPYLVPHAAILLQDIGQTFFDSLQVKGIPLHRFVVTSVLRTQNDVKSLRNYNQNAMENSCHLYGTTFDICYNRYDAVEDPDGPISKPVYSDILKRVLSEVLNDMREQERCYIKYEVKQQCFHLTVR